MKKPLSKYKVLIIQHNAEKRRERARHVKNKMKAVGYTHDDGSKNKTSKNRVKVKYDPRRGKEVIELPEQFNLENNFVNVVDKINQVAKCIKMGTDFYIDFDKIKNIGVSATLMLAAELSIYKIVKGMSLSGKGMRAYDSNWDESVRNRLKEMGFFELLNVESQVEKTPKNGGEQEIFIKFTSGTENVKDGTDVQKFITNVKSTLTKGKIPKGLSLHLHAGMSEAINNTVEHAYKGNKEEEQNRWWISASVNRNNREMKVICYDRGLTISKTIRETETKLKKIKMFLSSKDHEIIMATMKHKQSSTKESNRGNGLSSLIGFIEKNGRGVMRVYSGKGMVQYDESRKHDNKGYNSDMLSSKMRGTLIEWSVILNNSNMEENYDNATEDSGRVFASADGQRKG